MNFIEKSDFFWKKMKKNAVFLFLPIGFLIKHVIINMEWQSIFGKWVADCRKNSCCPENIVLGIRSVKKIKG